MSRTRLVINLTVGYVILAAHAALVTVLGGLLVVYHDALHIYRDRGNHWFWEFLR